MANINLEDALSRALRATKQYVDNHVSESVFSGDYNDLTNRPCYDDSEIKTFTYDGDKTDKIVVVDMLVKISDDVIAFEDLKSAIVICTQDGETEEIKAADIPEEEQAYAFFEHENATGRAVAFMDFIFVIYNDNFELEEGILFPEKGIYVADFGDSVYINSLTAQSQEIKQLDEKFIPDTIARVNDLPGRVYEHEIFISNEEIVENFDETDIGNRHALFTIDCPIPFNKEFNCEIDYLNEKFTLEFYNEDNDPETILYGFTWLVGEYLRVDINQNQEDSNKIDICFYEPGNTTFIIGNEQYASDFSMKVLDINYIDERALPDSIARMEDVNILIEENGFSGDYNDLENRPCYDDSKLIEYIYDGDSTGKLIVDNTFVKVSDDTTITYEEFKNSIVTINNGGTIIEVIMSEEQENQMYSKVENETGSCYMMDEGIMMIVLNDNFEHSNTLFPEKGIYFIDHNLTSNEQMSAYTSKFSVNKSNIKQLDEKFIPDTIARVSDLEQAIEENGFSGDYNDLENKPCYDNREFETVQILCDGNFEGKETLDNMYFAPFAKIADLNDNDIDSILSNGFKAIIKIYQRGENDELVLIEDLVSYSLQPVGGYDGLYSMKDNEFVLIATKDITEPISITKGLWVYNGNVDENTLVCTYDISYERRLSGELKQLDGQLLPEGLPYDTREFEEVKLAIDENFDIAGKETAIWQVEEIENEETVTHNMMFAKLYDSDFDVQKVVHEGLIEFYGVGYGVRYPASDYCRQVEEFYSIFDQFIVAEKDGTIFTKGIWGLYSIDGEINYNPDEDELMSLIFKTLKNGKLRIMDSKFIPYKPGLIIEEGTEVTPWIWYINEKDGVYATGDKEFSIGKGAEIFNDYCADINDYTSTLVSRNIAIGDYSHAEGRASYAKGYCSHTEGYNTYAAKDCTHAEGRFCQAVGECSHAEGSLTQALGKNQHVQGILNIPDPDNKYVHIVGNGTLEDEENLDGITFSNAHTLDWNGNAWFQGNVSVDGTPANDKDLVTKKYVDDIVANTTPEIITEEDINNIIANIDN